MALYTEELGVMERGGKGERDVIRKRHREDEVREDSRRKERRGRERKGSQGERDRKH